MGWKLEAFCFRPIKLELLPGFSFIFCEMGVVFILHVSYENQM